MFSRLIEPGIADGTAEALVVRKNSKIIKIANLASMKSNTCNCWFSRKGIFSHDR
jgi:hypothetical protein